MFILHIGIFTLLFTESLELLMVVTLARDVRLVVENKTLHPTVSILYYHTDIIIVICTQ